MIISQAEIRRCIDAIEASGSGAKTGYSYLTSAERANVDSYRTRLAALPSRGNDRLRTVKKAVALSDYRVGSDEVAEKLLGRIISDKLR